MVEVGDSTEDSFDNPRGHESNAEEEQGLLDWTRVGTKPKEMAS